MPVGRTEPFAADGAIYSDPLNRWLAQERDATALPPLAEDDDGDRLPSGWWIVPAALAALPLWALLIRAAVRSF